MPDMPPLPLSPTAARLDAQLKAAQGHHAPEGHSFHVARIGTGFYFAYEQLRNAAENREHHLLLRSAIERYLTRYVNLYAYRSAAPDLVTELTQSGYLKNDSVSMAKLEQIDEILGQYAELLSEVGTTKTASRKTVTKWVFQIASGQIEDLLSSNRRLAIFMGFSYEHYFHAVDAKLAEDLGGTSTQEYQIALYCAVQRAIFKSDLATTRYYCLAASLPGLNAESFSHFIKLNFLLDELYQAPPTNRLFRLVNRYGAPMRILRELLASDSATDVDLMSRADVLSRIKRLCQKQYSQLNERLNKRIAKTILFIFITKVLIGVAIEVPYDVVAAGAIAWMPLIINIAFPVVYMVLLSLRIAPPDRHNTELIAAFIDRILYQDVGAPVEYRVKQRVNSSSLRATFNAVYVVGFLLSFGLLSWLLYRLQFNAVNGFIFFIFLSAVSFLGYRLRQLPRELAMLDARQGIIQTLADFLSTPFVKVGYWLSDRYSRLNLVSRILDMMIEMPLKTTLRLVQQWIGFLRDKQEEI